MASLESRAGDVTRAVRRFEQSVSGGGIRVSISDDDTGGTRGFDRVFVGLGATLDAIPDVLRNEAAAAARVEFARNFVEERGRSGWAPLAPRTVAERVRLGYGGRHPIQVRTGALRAHVLGTKPEVTTGGGGVTLRIAPGKGMRKYAWLAKGTRTIPPRPMVVLKPDASARVTSAISRALRQRAARNGIG